MRWQQLETERKYSLAPARANKFAASVLRWVQPRVYDVERPIAYARTTYLDTDDLAYMRSAEGPTRQRLRIREYAGAERPGGPVVLTGSCHLELKVSAGGKRAKTRLASSQSEADGELESYGVSPKLCVWYRRLSLGDSGARVRITLDTEIEFSRPSSPGVVHAGPRCILEVKYYDAAPGWLAELMAPLGEPQPLSKYDLGMRAFRDAAQSAVTTSRYSPVCASPPDAKVSSAK